MLSKFELMQKQLINTTTQQVTQQQKTTQQKATQTQQKATQTQQKATQTQQHATQEEIKILLQYVESYCKQYGIRPETTRKVKEVAVEVLRDLGLVA